MCQTLYFAWFNMPIRLQEAAEAQRGPATTRVLPVGRTSSQCTCLASFPGRPPLCCVALGNLLPSLGLCFSLPHVTILDLRITGPFPVPFFQRSSSHSLQVLFMRRTRFRNPNLPLDCTDVHFPRAGQEISSSLAIAAICSLLEGRGYMSHKYCSVSSGASSTELGRSEHSGNVCSVENP